MTMPDGRWNAWYDGGITAMQPFGNSSTYEIGARFLSNCRVVEDWGCGLGWFRGYCRHGYVGIDGSHTPHADVYADLRHYRSDVDGIFMRHVLEHNHEWQRILDNAMHSFRDSMVVILFTPLALVTHQIGGTMIDDVEIPDYSFRLDDLTDRTESEGITASWMVNLPSPDTQYGVEHVLLLERR